jgi:hypothetical protein
MRLTLGWTLVAVLGMSLAALAQESRASRFNLLDEAPPLAGAGEEQQDQQKKKEQEPPTYKVQATPLQDELGVGPTNKPLWTDHRASPVTRIYLQVDPGEVGFEQWFDIRVSKRTGVNPTEVRMSEEFEFGLGYRFQLDLYANTIFQETGSTSTLDIRSWAGELRWALANWGEIPTNPTLYLEYILWNTAAPSTDGAAASLEGKVLLGDDLAPGWHWGANFFVEHTLNGSVLETGVTLSVFATIIDQVLSGGFATEYVYEADGPPLVPTGPHIRTRGLYLGPSLQIRFAPTPTEVEVNGVPQRIKKPRAHLDIEPLWGLTGESDRARVTIIFGWDF